MALVLVALPNVASLLLARRGGLLCASPNDAREVPSDWGEDVVGATCLPLGDRDDIALTIPLLSLDPDLERKSSMLPHTGMSGTASVGIKNRVPGVPVGMTSGVAIKKLFEFAELLEFSCLDMKLNSTLVAS